MGKSSQGPYPRFRALALRIHLQPAINWEEWAPRKSLGAPRRKPPAPVCHMFAAGLALRGKVLGKPPGELAESSSGGGPEGSFGKMLLVPGQRWAVCAGLGDKGSSGVGCVLCGSQRCPLSSRTSGAAPLLAWNRMLQSPNQFQPAQYQGLGPMAYPQRAEDRMDRGRQVGDQGPAEPFPCHRVTASRATPRARSHSSCSLGQACIVPTARGNLAHCSSV